jgi:hypothetical protein
MPLCYTCQNETEGSERPVNQVLVAGKNSNVGLEVLTDVCRQLTILKKNLPPSDD